MALCKGARRCSPAPPLSVSLGVGAGRPDSRRPPRDEPPCRGPRPSRRVKLKACPRKWALPACSRVHWAPPRYARRGAVAHRPAGWSSGFAACPSTLRRPCGRAMRSKGRVGVDAVASKPGVAKEVLPLTRRILRLRLLKGGGWGEYDTLSHSRTEVRRLPAARD